MAPDSQTTSSTYEPLIFRDYLTRLLVKETILEYTTTNSTEIENSFGPTEKPLPYKNRKIRRKEKALKGKKNEKQRQRRW